MDKYITADDKGISEKKQSINLTKIFIIAIGIFVSVGFIIAIYRYFFLCRMMPSVEAFVNNNEAYFGEVYNTAEPKVYN